MTDSRKCANRQRLHAIAWRRSPIEHKVSALREQEGGLAAIAEVPAALQPGDSDLAFLGPHLPDHIACAIAAGGPSAALPSFRSRLVGFGRCASERQEQDRQRYAECHTLVCQKGKLRASAHI